MTTATVTKTRSKATGQARTAGKNKRRIPEDETAYLLKSPANAEHLRQAIADLDAGKGRLVTLDELRTL